MVLLPYDDVQKVMAKRDDDDMIDFSKNTDSPFMGHIKHQMKNILRDGRLSAREKSLMYHQLLRKYHVSKGNVMKATNPKTPDVIVPPEVQEQEIIHSTPDDSPSWWDEEEMPLAAQIAESSSRYFNGPNEHQYRDPHPELTDDESTDYEDMTIQSSPEARPYSQLSPVHENIRPRNMKRNLENDYDDDEEEARSSKRQSTLDAIQEHIRRRNSKRYPEDQAEAEEEHIRLRNSKRYLKDQSEGVEVPRSGINLDKLKAIRRRKRRNAIDSPPRDASTRLRHKIDRPKPLRYKIVPSDEDIYNRASVIDRRFVKNPRKREASKLFAGKRGWLGRRRKHDIPPQRKQPKFTADGSDDDDAGAVGGVEWSQLPK